MVITLESHRKFCYVRHSQSFTVSDIEQRASRKYRCWYNHTAITQLHDDKPDEAALLRYKLLVVVHNGHAPPIHTLLYIPNLNYNFKLIDCPVDKSNLSSIRLVLLRFRICLRVGIFFMIFLLYMIYYHASVKESICTTTYKFNCTLPGTVYE